MHHIIPRNRMDYEALRHFKTKHEEVKKRDNSDKPSGNEKGHQLTQTGHLTDDQLNYLNSSVAMRC